MITGTVSVTVRESDRTITVLHFEASLDDLYDGNYKGWGNQEIATVEAGYPTLGQGGRTFQTHLKFENTYTDFPYDGYR